MEGKISKNIKLLISLVMLIFLASCKKAATPVETCIMPESEQHTFVEGEVGEDPPNICEIPEMEPEANLVMNISLKNFPEDREAKMRDAIERLMIVINSKEFKNRVLEHTYNDEATFVDNDDLTNEEIYYKLMDGAETLSPEVDEEIDINVTLYYKNNSTVGYTYPNSDRIWVNDKFFATNSLGKVAANLVHEWSHKVGFGHDHSRTSRRNYSVPYGVGTIVRELVDGM